MNWLGWFHKARDAVDETRWVMLDVETSGLDAARDRLLAVAAIAMRVDWAGKQLAIVPGDSFEVVLRQDEASAVDNILLHGIGAQRQCNGVPAGEALHSLRAYAGASPLLAFHADFDRTMIERHVRGVGGIEWSPSWVDVEHLCAVTHERVPARSLDEWMAHFGIRCAVRHQAAADTLAECELLLRIWPKVAPECGSWRDIERLAARQRWIARA